MVPSAQIYVCLEQGHSKGHFLELSVSITEAYLASLYIVTGSHTWLQGQL